MSRKKVTTSKVRRAAAKVEHKVAPKAKAMAEASTGVRQQIAESIDEMREKSRQNLLAGVGLIARARDVGKVRFAELVEEGRRNEPKVKKAFRAFMEKLQPKTELKFDLSKLKIDTAKFDRAAIQHRLEKGMTDSYHRMGLPTRKEVQTLARRVDKLAEMQGA